MKSKVALVILLIITAVYLNNSSLFVKPAGKPFLLAHRGLAQTFPMEGLTAETNTAARIYEPEHPYLENTLPSMAAAFAAGADMVEFDVQATKDGQLAVFHDAILDYRTNGTGRVRDYTMAELKQLDVGYGYTADGGRSYPFRGQGVGLMPSLAEVFEHSPDHSFLINIKSNDPYEGELLAEYLLQLPAARRAKLAAYGGERPMAVLKERVPDLRVMSLASMKRGLITYLLVGWTGYVPAEMRQTYLHLPLKYARYLWGWPHRFIQRIEAADSLFVVVAGSGKWSEGFDTVESLKEIPPNYSGGIWTNRIDRIGPVFK